LDVIGSAIKEYIGNEEGDNISLSLTVDFVGYSYDFRSIFETTDLFPTALCYQNIRKTLKIVTYSLELLRESLLSTNFLDFVGRIYFPILYLPSLYIRPLTLDVALGCLCDNCDIFKEYSVKKINIMYKRVRKLFKETIKDLELEGKDAKEVIVSDPVVHIARLSERVYSADRLIDLEDVEIDRLIVRDNRYSLKKNANDNPEFNKYNFDRLTESISRFSNSLLEDKLFREWSTLRTENIAKYNKHLFNEILNVLQNLGFQNEVGILFKPTPSVYNVHTPYEILAYNMNILLKDLQEEMVILKSKEPVIDIDIAKILLRQSSSHNTKIFVGPIDNSNFINQTKFYNTLTDTIMLARAHCFLNPVVSYYSSKNIKEFIKKWMKGSVTENEKN